MTAFERSIIAAEFKHVAELKEHSGGKYFVYTMLFGIYGILLVIALPTRPGIRRNAGRAATTLRASVGGGCKTPRVPMPLGFFWEAWGSVFYPARKRSSERRENVNLKM